VHYSASLAAVAEQLHHVFLEIQQPTFGGYRLERTYSYMTQTAARDAFVALPATDRDALICFLKSL
jgi:hypothetical protein